MYFYLSKDTDTFFFNQLIDYFKSLLFLLSATYAKYCIYVMHGKM